MTGTICPACEEHHIHSVPRGAEYPTGWGCEGCGAGGRDAELDHLCQSTSINGYRCERIAHPEEDRTGHRAIITNGTQLVEWDDGQTTSSSLVPA